MCAVWRQFYCDKFNTFITQQNLQNGWNVDVMLFHVRTKQTSQVAKYTPVNLHILVCVYQPCTSGEPTQEEETRSEKRETTADSTFVTHELLIKYSTEHTKAHERSEKWLTWGWQLQCQTLMNVLCKQPNVEKYSMAFRKCC